MFAATLHPFPVSEFLLNRHSTFVWKIFTLDYPTGTNGTKYLRYFLGKITAIPSKLLKNPGSNFTKNTQPPPKGGDCVEKMGIQREMRYRFALTSRSRGPLGLVHRVVTCRKPVDWQICSNRADWSR